ncbi:PspC domain-containing protein [Vallitalea sp.]|uniref:PspC domain-containing protein n=1 Tax=Vallitalea sp. TaxID=1882829 RepID=UPI0025E235FD|nr:PspC domain-containing protein [Vallitalea sp.]MCT4685848.1 PspC domain-containing protein [Vallitalea sp.]
MDKRLFRSRDNQMICGVCSGIAKYFNIDPTIVRILFLITLFTWGTGVLIYIICSIVIPFEPIEYAHNTYDSGTHNGNGRTILGIILVIIGGISILEKIFDWFSFDLVWPIAIIGIGFLILTKDRN